MKTALKKYGIAFMMCCVFAFAPYTFGCCDCCKHESCGCSQVSCEETDQAAETDGSNVADSGSDSEQEESA